MPAARALHTEAGLDHSAASRIRSARILRGILLLLIPLELASRAGAAPSLVHGGIAELLALPFFPPSMLGVLAFQYLLRPDRRELAAAGAVAAALFVPLRVFMAQASSASTLMCALGFGSLLAMSPSALLQRGRGRAAALE